jgi:hypothetical protein
MITGAVTALAVALVFRLIPDDFPDSLSGRITLFAVGLATGPVFVVVIRWWATLIKSPLRRPTTVATVGALVFDSLMTGFAPQFYGHHGAASTVVFASIVFGAVSIIVSEFLMPERK